MAAREFQMDSCASFQIQKWNAEELISIAIHLTYIILRAIVDVLCLFSTEFLLSVILFSILYAAYRAYLRPPFLKKELTDIGFDHVTRGTKGANRSLQIARSQMNRQLGGKVPPPYPNGWYALAESRDLSVRKVIPVDALGLNLCIYRGEDGVARIVDAYCPHLGANIGVGGTVRGNCIECPFHNWQFGDDGICTHIPDIQNVPKGISIRSWDCMEVDGAVWVWYDAEKRPPLWTVPPLDEIKDWGYRGRNEFIISSHIRDIPENGADAAHLNCIHKMSFLTDIGKRLPFLNNIIGFHTWQTDWRRTDDWHIAEMTIDQSYFMFKHNVFPFKIRVKQIGPSHVRLLFTSIFGETAVLQSVTPIGPMLQKVVHRIYTPTSNAIAGALLVYAEARQFERDVVIWNNKTHVSSPPYVKTDRTIRAFRDWFSQYYSEQSISMRDAIQKPLDW
ncbi:unnamed protein product [Leptosia nina]|uniref:cholesterol 7-desaturase n=1 Tax=Leptosia nina TaxID=320188 RepID=A0AAV1JXW4_9NEOP